MKLNYKFDIKNIVLVLLAVFYIVIISSNILGNSMEGFKEGADGTTSSGSSGTKTDSGSSGTKSDSGSSGTKTDSGSSGTKSDSGSSGTKTESSSSGVSTTAKNNLLNQVSNLQNSIQQL